MKVEEVWQWKIRWGKRMASTRFKATEEFMSTAYPGALKIPGTMERRKVFEKSDTSPSTHPPFSWQGPAAEQARLDAEKLLRAADGEP